MMTESTGVKTVKLFAYLCFVVLPLLTSAEAQTRSLDGNWNMLKDQLNVFSVGDLDTAQTWRTAKVPNSWQLQFPDLLDYQGVIWYKKSLIIKKKDEHKRYIIHFEAVDYLSKLYVNSAFAGEHEGGYTPFDFDITQYLKNGENKLVLRVMDPAEDSVGTDGISYWNIPHGKQSWYVQTSGIWQSVSLLIKPQKFITRIKIDSKLNGEFSTKIFFDGDNNIHGDRTLDFVVFNKGHQKVFEGKCEIDTQSTITINGKIEHFELWELNNPKLYTIEIKYADDNFTGKFGFREFTSRDGKFYLNGKPFFMIAALDQGFYPETVYQIPSEEYLQYEMMKAKKLGLNTLRCHIKVPDQRYLDIADELGLLVWYEIPNWDTLNESVKTRARFTIDKMLERDWNHPSLVVLSIINESWGIDLSKPDQREWLKLEYDYVKNLAPGRLVVDNSACWGNFHLKTDINDYHTYYAIPENYKKFSATIQDVASRPKWLFSSFGDAEETGKEILMISEFGNWGLPKLPQRLPFWFNRKFGDASVVLPEGVHQRFKEYNYKNIFGSYDHLAEASQRAQFAALKFEIEEIRLQNPIQGYVITEFTDINWECNGLLDMWRNYKSNDKELACIQQPDVIIPRTDKYNYWDDETVSLKIFISHYSPSDLTGAKIIWNVSGSPKGEIVLPSIGESAVKEITEVKIPLKKISGPEKLVIKLEMINKEKRTIAKNFTEVFLYPLSKTNQKQNIEIGSAALKNLSHKLEKRGYGITSDSNATLIVNAIDESVLTKLKNGAKVICLVDSTTKIVYRMPFNIISRDSAWLDGNWASNLNWTNISKGPFNKINFGRTLGFESEKAIPQYVLGGVASQNYDDVLSGMFIGWVHSTSGYLLQMKVGKGKLITTTFRLTDNYEVDPYSTILLDEIIRYISSEECNPKMNWN